MRRYRPHDRTLTFRGATSPGCPSHSASSHAQKWGCRTVQAASTTSAERRKEAGATMAVRGLGGTPSLPPAPSLGPHAFLGPRSEPGTPAAHMLPLIAALLSVMCLTSDDGSMDRRFLAAFPHSLVHSLVRWFGGWVQSSNATQREESLDSAEMSSEGDASAKLFIGGVSWQTSEAGLRAHFEQVCAEFLTCHL